MTKTIIEQLADFAVDSQFSSLPTAVVHECKRILLDSLGVALAATDHPKGAIGIQYGEMLGGSATEATIIGHGRKSSLAGAAFANGELINALDQDAVLPPGHVTPYVLPGIMAVAEARKISGAEVIRAMAVAHEMSNRMGKAMDYLRDTQDGKVSPPPVYGYSSTIFGATAAIAMANGWSRDVIAHGLGIGGCIAPVNSQVAWFQHAPSSTIKYLLAGALTQSAMTAAYMAQLGHRGDLQVLDDREYGFPRFIGTRRWEPEPITAELGVSWNFVNEQAYKPYPHCRILHALLDCQTAILKDNAIRPDEIDGIKVWVEGFVEQPVWLNRDIQHVHDAQFSIAHGIALGAQGVPPGKAWQDPELVFSPAVMALMDKVSHQVHPNYVELLTSHGASRPAKIEISARGQTFVAESRYPKGSPSPDPASYMTDEELVTKFRHNAEGAIPQGTIGAIVDEVFALDQLTDFSALMARVGGAVAR